MPTLIAEPTLIHAAGNKPKEIREFADAVTAREATGEGQKDDRARGREGRTKAKKS